MQLDDEPPKICHVSKVVSEALYSGKFKITDTRFFIHLGEAWIHKYNGGSNPTSYALGSQLHTPRWPKSDTPTTTLQKCLLTWALAMTSRR